ncbi:MAG: hypothetical protein HRT58_07685 [Crocinitomicaceae bacterium]|nr:hypothetical protein [Flavobacteriales bacterium]NQZ35531.1 hypothetical protein [Crocinitomicaceae bacterium]
MKKIAGIVALISAVVLTSCGGADSDTSPFVGKIEFKANGMGLSTKGSITMDAENERMTYRIDALEKLMGMDMAMMVDMKNKMTYTICASKGFYMESPMKENELKGELPSKEEVKKIREEFFSKLKKTGKTEVLNGLTCDEYELKEEAEGVESATIWVSKTMLDRMTANWSMMAELEKLGAGEMMIGFPMKGSFIANGKSGSFEVTKITEGKDALEDFDLSKMKKLSQKEFSKEMMESSAIGNMMESIKDMEEKGVFEDLKKDLDGLKNLDLEGLKDLDIDTKEIEKMIESLK